MGHPSQVPASQPASSPVNTHNGENVNFPRFNDFPKEIRLLIWAAALPGPRIVFLEYCYLKGGRCSRVWSDKAIDDFDSEMRASFFDIKKISDIEDHERDVDLSCSAENEMEIVEEIGDSGSTDSYEVRLNDMAYECDLGGFRPRTPNPVVLFVCRESYEVANRHYVRTFGTEAAFPSTWFNFEIDTLYLDWGFDGDFGKYHPSSFGDVAAKVKHLAVTNHPAHWSFYRRCLDLWECDVLYEFCNLETYASVLNRDRGKYARLVRVEEHHPLAWALYLKPGTVDGERESMDLEAIGEFRDEWFSRWSPQAAELEEAYGERKVEIDIDKYELKETQWIQEFIPPWKMPMVEALTRIIPFEIAKRMDSLLEEIEPMYEKLLVNEGLGETISPYPLDDLAFLQAAHKILCGSPEMKQTPIPWWMAHIEEVIYDCIQDLRQDS